MLAHEHPMKKQKSEDRRLTVSAVQTRRRKSIQEREHHAQMAKAAKAVQDAEKAQLCSTKYPKRDVLLLKSVFDEYDHHGNGYISFSELRGELNRQKKEAQRYDGSKLTLQERQARNGRTVGRAFDSNGTFLVSFADSLFRVLDDDEDGRVTFEELLKVVYPLAMPAEVQTMLAWATPELDDEAKWGLDELSTEQERETRAMFNLYDVDRSGTISKTEYKNATRRCGLTKEQIASDFAAADANGDKELDYDEWRKFMVGTGLYTGRPLFRQQQSVSAPTSRASTPTNMPYIAPGAKMYLSGSPSAAFAERFAKR